eukprot:363418-Chlamydomonas_euryale.AAC.10
MALLQMLKDVDEAAKAAGSMPVEAFTLQLYKSLAAHRADGILPPAIKVALQYRVCKKMILWDAVAAISAVAPTVE